MCNKSLLLSVVCLSIFFWGCGPASKSPESDSNSSKAIQKTETSSSIYYAKSRSYQTPEKELSECLFDVARQVSLRRKVFVRYTVSSEPAPDGTSWLKTTVELEYDQHNSIAILERLSVLTVERTEEGTEAQIRLEGDEEFSTPVAVMTVVPGSGPNPAWIEKPPEGKNFIASVGSVSQISNRAEAFTNADTHAIGGLASIVSQPKLSGEESVYSIELNGVYIAARWYNPEENRYYSLAIYPR